MEKISKKGNPVALLPIGIFLVIFIGSGILMKDFYSMPAIVGFLIALFVAFLQNRSLSFSKKFSIVAKGVGDENIVTMYFIFLLAGGFSGAIKAAGGDVSTVNFGLSILPPSVAIAGLFVIGAFISVSMGTSMGTIAALAPIAVGISEKTGFSMAICIAAVCSGAMFGDNLSMISDTTIAAVRTQGCQMKDKFKANFLLVLPAAIVTLIIFLVITVNSSYDITGNLDYNLLKVLPYLLVLVGALIGFNVFAVLISGIVLSLIVGIGTGTIPLKETFTSVGTGITGMYDITIISMTVAAIISLVKAHGGIQYILNFIKSKVHTPKGGQLGIAALASVVDISTANNTIAIVMAGPIAKDISEEYNIDPVRSASILDIFTSVFQGLIPYGAQLLSAAAFTKLSPMAIVPFMFYPMFMAISALIFIVFQRKDSGLLKRH